MASPVICTRSDQLQIPQGKDRKSVQLVCGTFVAAGELSSSPTPNHPVGIPMPSGFDHTISSPFEQVLADGPGQSHTHPQVASLVVSQIATEIPEGLS